MLFPVPPQVLDRIQIGRISRKELQLDPAPGFVYKISHHAAAVGPEAVPDDNQIAVDGLIKCPRKSTTCGLLIVPQNPVY